MQSFRLDWISSTLCSRQDWRDEHRVLQTPWRSYFAVAAKLVPGLWRWPITLQLKTGAKIRVEEFMTLCIYHELFVEEVYEIPGLPEQDLKLAIDVGANSGLFALWFKQRFPEARVLCFEPFPTNYERLRHTIDTNNLANVDAFQAAVGGTAREDKLYIHPKNVGGHSIVTDSVGDNSISVEVKAIAQVIESLDGQVVDYFKLDCEGAEREILEATTAEHAQKINRVVYEPSPELYDVNSLEAHMSSLGYRVKREAHSITSAQTA